MIEPFLITNNLMGCVDGSIPCLSKSVTNGTTVPKENLNYLIWVSNDAHVRMLIISTISEASFRHVQGTTSRNLWLSLEKAYAPHSTSREYTLKTQLLRIEMHGDKTPDAYLNRLREEYNSLKTTITARQSPTVFNELHVIFSDHDYMLGKTRAPAPALGFQVSPIVPSGPQAFYGAHPSNNNRNNNNNNCGNRNNSRDTGANSHVTPDLKAMDNSEAYYGGDALHVGNNKGLPILHIGSSKGIIHRRSCPHTSEQNDFVERRNRHVVETDLTLLSQACVP
ncbi:nucleotide-binding alpha-beta plait domain-containing protein [Tanacetum coccineum]|uniref:Nucleotide-binding alpha-beta plait domain-containing protein n=1 Tax=Tanacetum coccineum TaxID=301880 RepID=A0ABQ5GYZ3_9ASTR